MTPTEAFVATLERQGCQPRARGDRWEAFCPAHGSSFNGHRDGRHPALGVAEGTDGRVLVSCAAGCDTGAILEALGIGWSDLFPPTLRSSWDDQIQMVYDYTDQDGTVLFQVVRFAWDEPGDKPKFLCRRWDGAGRWAWHHGACDTRKACTNGAHRRLDVSAPEVPYRLHRLVADLESPVWVVEGEKDVHTLERIGLLATCNRGGSNDLRVDKNGKPKPYRCKWTAELSEWFVDGDMIVVADQDRPGLLHALCVARSLAAASASVRLVDVLPGAKDVSELAEAVGDATAREVLEALADREPMTLDDGRAVRC